MLITVLFGITILLVCIGCFTLVVKSRSAIVQSIGWVIGCIAILCLCGYTWMLGTIIYYAHVQPR